MKKLSCHCGQVQIEINVENFENYCDAIVQFAKEKVQLCL